MTYFTDREILDALLTRETRAVNKAIEQLYHQNHKMITQLICTKGGSITDAEDIFQEMVVAFLQNVWSGKFELRSGTKLSTYLYEIAKNLWYKKVRANTASVAREKTYTQNLEETLPDEPDPLMQILEAEDVQTSLSIFKKLSLDAQQLLRAFYFDKLPISEITRRFRYVSDNATKMRKHRIMNELRDLL